MASAKCTGEHEPTGLDYLIDERILPPNPPSQLYRWTVYGEDHGCCTEEEVLATEQCVLWSQGGILQRIFRFSHENQEVRHALLTWFPSPEDAHLHRTVSIKDSQRNSHGVTSDPAQNAVSGSARGLVVILQGQAQIYFLNGNSSTVNIPFDVESAFPAPQGVLLQRRISGTPQNPPATPIPAPPPNSFWSSQVHHGSLQASIDTSRITATPKASSRSPNVLPETGASASSRDLPSLFTLRDPFSELGLAVEGVEAVFPSMSASLEPVSDKEKIIYITPKSEYYHVYKNDCPMIIIITANHSDGVYSIWYASYPTNDSPQHDQEPLAKGSMTPLRVPKSRRSQATRLSTGAGTPALRAGDLRADQSFSRQPQSSFDASKAPSQRLSESFMLDGEYDDNLGTLDEFPSLSRPGPPTRGTRRTSSMVARAELSSQDQHTFNDMARQPHAPTGSLGRHGKRPQSFGYGSMGRSRMSGRASTPGSISFLSDVDESVTNNGSTDFIEELLELANTEQIDRATFRSFRGLKKDLIMVRALTVPFEQASFSSDQAALPPEEDTHIAVIKPAMKAEASRGAFPLYIYIVHPKKRTASVLSIPTSIKEMYPPNVGRSADAGTRRLPIPSKPFTIRRLEGVDDIVKLHGPCSSYAVKLIGEVRSHKLSLVVQSTASMRIASQSYAEHQIDQDIVWPPQDDSERKDTRSLIGPVASSSHSPSSGSSFPQLQNPATSGQFDIVAEDTYRQVRWDLRPCLRLTKKVLDLCTRAIGCSLPEAIDLHDIWIKTSTSTTSENAADESSMLIMTLLVAIAACMGKRRGEIFAAAPSQNIATSCDITESNIRLIMCKQVAWSWPRSEWINYKSATIPTGPSLSSYLEQIRQMVDREMNVDSSIFRTLFRDADSRDVLARITIALFVTLMDEQCSMNNCDLSTRGIELLTQLLAQMAVWLGLQSLSTFLRSQFSWITGLDEQQIFSMETGLKSSRWPDIYNNLGVSDSASGNNLDTLMRLAEIDHPKSRMALVEPTQHSRLSRIPKLMEVQRTWERPTTIETKVMDLWQANVGFSLLESTHPETLLGLRQALAYCCHQPLTNSPKGFLTAIGRPELGQLSRVTESFDAPSSPKPLFIRDIVSICNLDEPQQTPEVPRLEIHENLLRYIFRDDKRWVEAARLVDPVRTAIASVPPIPGQPEAEFLEKQKQVAQKVYERTMALPSGQAIMRFGIHRPVLTEKLKISTFNTTCIMQPSNNSVNADKSNFTEEKVGWAFFHAGVNAGLQVSPDFHGVDTSWLVLNKPNDLGNRHAGLLLGLGLNGHLKKMARWLAFKYLTSKHTMTSVGLLLGLSASHLGTQDSLVTRLISVHVTRLLPPGAAQLNISPLTQTAGIAGVGLLYCNTQHRRMTEVMLSELEHVDAEAHGSATSTEKDESYRFAAGLSLGLINLASGNDLRVLHDMHVVQRLLTIATGPRSIKTISVVDQATTGAILALALIFMKTHDAAIASKLDPLDCAQQFDVIRPDTLLLRTTARWLVSWDEIEPSVDWIKRNSIPLPKNTDSVLDSDNIPVYNITAGLCWAIALRHAGTASSKAIDVLRHHLKIVKDLLANCPSRPSFDQNLTLDTLHRFQHLLALSMASVCAGTGDLTVLRELRLMHADLENKTFGLHQATHMAIGALFVGQGRFTFGTGNLAVAAMLIAFYPLFPRDVLDNRAHLQALRHFWVLATEPRTLIPRDVETKQPVNLEVKVTLRNDANNSTDSSPSSQARSLSSQQTVISCIAPCRLPPLIDISSIHTTSTEYYPVTLDFENNPEHVAAFKRHQSIFLQRRPPFVQHSGVFGAEVARLNQRQSDTAQINRCLDWLFDLSVFRNNDVDGVAQGIVHAFGGDTKEKDDRPVGTLLDLKTTPVDDLCFLHAESQLSEDSNALRTLERVLAAQGASQSGQWLRHPWLDSIKNTIWTRTKSDGTEASNKNQGLDRSREAMELG